MSKHKLRKYPESPWKEDKIKCVIVMKTHDKNGKAIEKDIMRVFVAKDTESKLSSDEVSDTLTIEKRFKYNLGMDMKMSIPRRIFLIALKNPNIDTYFITPTKGTANLIAYDKKTKIKKEIWLDPDGKQCVLFFREGLLVKIGDI